MAADLLPDHNQHADPAAPSSAEGSHSLSNPLAPSVSSSFPSSSLADALGPLPSGSSWPPSSSSAAAANSRLTQDAETQGSSPPSERTCGRANIGLSTDKSLTTHGRPRERVYLACLQCRNRKVRCDGNKPECFNCVKRADPNLGLCSYDATPRRRGKDRTPGSRKLAPLETKKTRTTRSRVEEEAKRKKAEAVARAAPVIQPARSFQDSSGSSSAHHAALTHALPKIRPKPRPSNPPPTYNSVPPRMALIDIAAPFGWQSSDNEFATRLPDLPDFLYASEDALTLTSRIEDEEDVLDPDSQQSLISTPPSVQFTRETWWDALLSFYTSHPSCSWSSAPLPSYGAPLTMIMREEATAHIAADLRFLFHVSLHWFAFIHVPRFFGSLLDPYHRQALQPSLVLALLALGTFFQSSELELGARGRERALHLLDQAHATFQASLNSGWIDVGLVQAAWLLAMFEMQAHPKCATPRTRSAFLTLDSLIRSLHLTTLDINDARTTTFTPGVVPVVSSTVPNRTTSYGTLSTSLPEGTPHSGMPPLEPVFQRPEGTYLPNILQPDHILPDSEDNHGSHISQSAPAATFDPQGLHNRFTYTSTARAETYDHSHIQWDCGCSQYSLMAGWPLTGQMTPAWNNMPMWPRGVSEGEMQQEECRRLVWCTVMLTVSHNTKTAAGTDQERQHLWIKDPANYALLFPGENLASATPDGPHIPASKESVWALYMRTLFLWNSCLRSRSNASLSNADRAQYAMTAWLELDNVEAAMDRHTCDIQTGFMLQMREVLFNTRMVISNEFRRYIPQAMTENGQALYRRKAKQWMTYMLNLANAFRESQLISARGKPTANSRRCLLSYWFMAQIMRALGLWHADRSLTIALEVAKAFAPCVEFMMMIWPSPSQRKEYEGLRHWLVRSCQLAGIPPPERAIPPLKTGLSPPPAPTAMRSSTAQAGPSSWEPAFPNPAPTPPHLLNLGSDLFREEVAGAYHPTQSQRLQPQLHLQPQLVPPPSW